MTTYNKDFKDKLIKLMLPPENRSVKELVGEYGIHEQTLYKWRKDAKSKGVVYQDNGTSRQNNQRRCNFRLLLKQVC